MISGTVPMFPVGVGERSLAIESRMEVRKRKIPVIPDRMLRSDLPAGKAVLYAVRFGRRGRCGAGLHPGIRDARSWSDE